MKQKLGVGLSEQPPHGSASVPNTGAPSLASAKRLAEHVAGRRLVSASQHKGPPAAVAGACRVYAPGGSTHRYSQWRPSPGQGEVNSIEI